MPPLNTPGGSKFHRRQQQAETTDWIDQFRSEGSPRPTHLDRAIITSWNTMMQIFIHRVVHSVVNLIEKHKVLTFILRPNSKDRPNATFRTANNTIQQTRIKLRQWQPYGGTILKAGQNISFEIAVRHTCAIKQLFCSVHDSKTHRCL